MNEQFIGEHRQVKSCAAEMTANAADVNDVDVAGSMAAVGESYGIQTKLEDLSKEMCPKCQVCGEEQLI